MIKLTCLNILLFLSSLTTVSSALFSDNETNAGISVSDTAMLSETLNAAELALDSRSDSVLIFAKNAIAIADRIINNEKAADDTKYKKLTALNIIVRYFHDLSYQYDSSLVYGLNLLETSKQYYEDANDEHYKSLFQRRLANTMMDVGVAYFEQSEFDRAITFYNNAFEEGKLMKDSLLQSKALLNTGMIYNNQGRYDEAIRNYYAAIDIFERLNDTKGIAISYLSIGNIQRKQNSPEQAIKSYNKSFDLFKTLEDERGQSVCYNNLGIAYVELENYDEGLVYYNKALEIYKKLGRYRNVSTMYSNMAVLYEILKEYDKAIDYIQKSMTVISGDISSRNLMGSYSNLAGIYLAMIKDKPELLRSHPTYIDSVIIYAERGLALADTLDFILEKAAVVNILKDAYAIDRNYSKAYEMADLLVDLNDSIYNTEKLKIIAEADTKFEARQKELQITQQQYLIDDQELMLKHTRTFRNLLAIITVLMLLVLALFYYLYKQKHKAHRILDEKNNLIEKQNLKITAKKEELEAAYQKLTELIQFKDKMTGMIVHDLKNPVSNILNSHIIEDSAFREKLINQSGYDMLNLIQNLLDLYKLEETQIEIHNDLIFLTHIIRENILELSLYVSEKDLKIVYPEDEVDYFIADVSLFKRIFSNLLSNAVKYAPDGTEIIIATSVLDSNARQFSVRNKGVPIPKEIQTQLFDRFRQFNARDIGNSVSTGLGLSFCKMAVELHGGEIGVNSDENWTEFWFTIPQKKA